MESFYNVSLGSQSTDTRRANIYVFCIPLTARYPPYAPVDKLKLNYTQNPDHCEQSHWHAIGLQYRRSCPPHVGHWSLTRIKADISLSSNHLRRTRSSGTDFVTILGATDCITVTLKPAPRSRTCVILANAKAGYMQLSTHWISAYISW